MRPFPVFASATFLALGALGASLLGACSAGDDDAATGAEQALASSVHVLTSRNDANRTGANTQEKILTTTKRGGRPAHAHARAPAHVHVALVIPVAGDARQAREERRTLA